MKKVYETSRTFPTKSEYKTWTFTTLQPYNWTRPESLFFASWRGSVCTTTSEPIHLKRKSLFRQVIHFFNRTLFELFEKNYLLYDRQYRLYGVQLKVFFSNCRYFVIVVGILWPRELLNCCYRKKISEIFARITLYFVWFSVVSL